jgi:hypothetical protein
MSKNRIGFGSDLILFNSNVGIGTTRPTEKLHVVGIISATSYRGDGSQLTNIVSVAGVGLNTVGGNVGYGATVLDFRGSGISTITLSSGIGTIYIEGGGSQGTGSQGTQGVQGLQGTLGSCPHYHRHQCRLSGRELSLEWPIPSKTKQIRSPKGVFQQKIPSRINLEGV